MSQQQIPGVITSGGPVIAKIASNGIQLAIAFVGAALAVVSIVVNGLTWVEVSAFLLFYALTGMGVGVGLHRLFTHKTYECVTWFRWVIGALSAMTFQGTILRWVSDHRRHHAHADAHGDPHSPFVDAHGRPIRSRWRGFWHAHVGWFVDRSTTDPAVFGKGLMADPVARFYTRTYWFWVGMSLFLPWIYGLALGGSLEMAWRTLLVGGCLRIVVLYNVTWSVNSFCHLFGARPWADVRAVNCAPLAFMTFGEAWHNNHHRYPRSARNGLRKGELDINARIIYALARLGIVQNIIEVAEADIVPARPGGPVAASTANAQPETQPTLGSLKSITSSSSQTLA